MRALIGFFAGVMIIALVAAATMVAARIYDHSRVLGINAVVLQNADLHQNRIAAPTHLAEYPATRLRNRLIATVAAEYLGVVPNSEELAARASGRGLLRLVLGADALLKWRADVLPGLERMAEQKKMRRVIVDARGIYEKGDYFVVPFETKTWDDPNDLNAAPITIKGAEMYMKLRFNKKVRETYRGERFDPGEYLDRGFPPAAIFEFIVDEIIIK